MTCNILIGRLLLVSALLGWTVLPANQEDLNQAGGAVVVLELKAQKKRKIPLDQDRLVLLQKDGQCKEIPVVLEHATCKFRVKFVREEETQEQVGYLPLYELRSSDPDLPYTWALFCGWPLARFRLFSNERGENYLAWIRGSAIQFAEVSKPKDRSLALAEAFSRKPPPDIVYVPVGDLVPEVDFWGVNAFYSDITILSVAKDEAGNWIVKISDPSGKKVFTLVSEGDKRENWRKK